MQEEKKFYKELDDKNRKKKEKTLSPWVLVIFFMLFIIVLELLVFYIGKSLKTDPSEGFTKATESSSGVDLISESGQSSEYIVNVPEGLLCAKLAKQISEDVRCSIGPEAIMISGKLSALLPANSTVSFVPEVKNGEAKLKLTELKIGAIKAGQFLAGPLESEANNALKTALVGQNVIIKRIDLEQGIMVILAQPK